MNAFELFCRQRWKYGMVMGKTDAQTLEAGNMKPLIGPSEISWGDGDHRETNQSRSLLL